jgi:hypothetical protein
MSFDDDVQLQSSTSSTGTCLSTSENPFSSLRTHRDREVKCVDHDFADVIFDIKEAYYPIAVLR